MQSEFTKWLKTSTWPTSSASFELKVSANDRLPPSKVPEHQVVDLLACESLAVDWQDTRRGLIPVKKHFVHKFSDSALGYKTFDCFTLRHALAFLVVGFNDAHDVVAVPIQAYAKTWLAGCTLSYSKALSDDLKGVRLRQDNKWVVG